MIEIENLTKRYGSATVVDRVSISIPRGSITVIVGTSGVGQVDAAAHDQPPGRADERTSGH